MDHSLKIDHAQLEALNAGSARAVRVATSGDIQKGDTVTLEAEPGDLPLGEPFNAIVSRVHAGTEKNGIVKGWAVLEVAIHE